MNIKYNVVRCLEQSALNRRIIITKQLRDLRISVHCRYYGVKELGFTENTVHNIKCMHLQLYVSLLIQIKHSVLTAVYTIHRCI